MHRKITADLVAWKDNPRRKPLLLQGARQVGKTYLMKAFGSQYFEKVAYVNFDSSTRIQHVFQQDFSINRILATLEIETGVKIEPHKTLLILDEIQEAPKGIASLKYFQELAPEYAVIAAGSLLGVSINQQHSFPVGKVDFMNLYPLSFEEFLLALKEDKLVETLVNRDWDVLRIFHEKLIEYLRLYYFIGGMPEVVNAYAQDKDISLVRPIQQKLLWGYENDFAKYAPISLVPKIRMVWQTILRQLAKENRKFIYSQIKQGARAKEFEDAIHWLVNAGLLLRSNLLAKPAIPLKSYVIFDAFKLFLLDVGLLNAMGEVNEQILLNKNQILSEFKGALTEQYVAQELALMHPLHYWNSENATAEVDFLIQQQQMIIPIEVKAEENLKAKSLKVFVDKYNTQNNIRFSMNFYRKESWLENVPLYAVFAVINNQKT